MFKTSRVLDYYDEIDIKRHDDEVTRLRIQVRWLAVVLFLNMILSGLIICRMGGLL